jgi:hypothetical protein
VSCDDKRKKEKEDAPSPTPLLFSRKNVKPKGETTKKEKNSVVNG